MAFAGIGTVSIPDSETQVMAAKYDRTWFVIQNPGTNAVWLKLDSSTNALTTTNGFKLDGGATLSVSATKANLTRNAIKAISETATTNTITYQEGNEN